MNYRIVCNVLGKVLLAEALLLMLPLAAALACAESPLPFIFTILPLAAAGGELRQCPAFWSAARICRRWR